MDVDHQTEFNTSADNWGNLQAHSPSLVSGSGFFGCVVGRFTAEHIVTAGVLVKKGQKSPNL